MDAEVSSANGTAPIGFGGQVRRRASNTASRRFESSTHNHPGPAFRQYACLTRGTNMKKPSISARAVESAPLLTCAFANLILAVAEELPTAQ
jgi:hypothetical protein